VVVPPVVVAERVAVVAELDESTTRGDTFTHWRAVTIRALIDLATPKDSR